MATSRRNKHHLAYPRTAYTTALERKFRSQPCLIVEMDVWVHKLLHSVSEPPKKPSVSEMREAIKRHQLRDCGCY